MATTARPEARDALFRMISGYQLAQLVHVVAVLRIADLLVLGPRSVDDLAAQTGANADRHLHGILFDQPGVVAAAKRTLEEAGVSERCELVGGDFFRAVPPGGDIYMLRSIIHDWDDMPATTILTNCERAMAEDGKLLVMESVIDAGEKSVAAKFLDVQMLVTTGGRERTVEEFEQLFAAAGLEVGRVIPVGVDGRIVEGVR